MGSAAGGSVVLPPHGPTAIAATHAPGKTSHSLLPTSLSQSDLELTPLPVCVPPTSPAPLLNQAPVGPAASVPAAAASVRDAPAIR